MRTILILFSFLMAVASTAQVDSMTVKSDHSELVKKCKGSHCKYWVDHKRVSQAEYEKHLSEPSMATCRPCYLKQYDDKGKLSFEGDFYTDCCIGAYITRYANGKIKVKGQYKVPPKDMLGENIYGLGYCRPEGEWTYFKENGGVEKVEVYKNGELVK